MLLLLFFYYKWPFFFLKYSICHCKLHVERASMIHDFSFSIAKWGYEVFVLKGSFGCDKLLVPPNLWPSPAQPVRWPQGTQLLAVLSPPGFSRASTDGSLWLCVPNPKWSGKRHQNQVRKSLEGRPKDFSLSSKASRSRRRVAVCSLFISKLPKQLFDFPRFQWSLCLEIILD